MKKMSLLKRINQDKAGGKPQKSVPESEPKEKRIICRYCKKEFASEKEKRAHQPCPKKPQPKSNKTAKDINSLKDHLGKQSEVIEKLSSQFDALEQNYEKVKKTEEELRERNVALNILVSEMQKLVESLTIQNDDLEELYEEKMKIFEAKKVPFQLNVERTAGYALKSFTVIPHEEWSKENKTTAKKAKLLEKYGLTGTNHSFQALIQRWNTGRRSYLEAMVKIVNSDPNECVEKKFVKKEGLDIKSLEVIRSYLQERFTQLISNAKTIKSEE